MNLKNNDFGLNAQGSVTINNTNATGVIYEGVGTGSAYRCAVNNTSSGAYSAALGGCRNTASNSYAVVVGGRSNCACANSAFIGAGLCNQITGLTGVLTGVSVTSFTGIIADGTYTNLTQSATSGSGSGAIFQATFVSNSITAIAPIPGYQGFNYAVGNSITIPGTQLGLLAPANNITLNVTGVTTTSACYSSIVNGCNFGSAITHNCIFDCFSTVLGGRDNKVFVESSFIAGGRANCVSAGCFGLVAGGFTNKNCGAFSSIISGQGNCISNVCHSFVGAGQNNRIFALASPTTEVGGSYSAILTGICSCICGSNFSYISTGCCNLTLNAHFSTIDGGNCNCICRPASVCYQAPFSYSSIIGGCRNTISCFYGAILGGFGNIVSGCITGAFGCNLNANANLTFYTNNTCACGWFYTACIPDKCLVCSNSGQLIGYSPNRGYFYDTTIQTATLPSTAYPMQLNSCDSSLTTGFTIVNDTFSNPVRVTATNNGVYNIQFSAQIQKPIAGGSTEEIDIWLRCNGDTSAADVPNSNGRLSIKANDDYLLAVWNYFLSLNAGEYFTLMWATTSTNIVLQADGIAAPHPATPSLILSVIQV